MGGGRWETGGLLAGLLGALGGRALDCWVGERGG